VTFFDFPQKGLLIDVATAPTTALALGNGPLLSTTLSFLSSRAQRADLRCAIRVPRSYRPTIFNHHRILMETPTCLCHSRFPGVVRGTADPSLRFGMTKKERVVARKGRLLNRDGQV
jgi:hypothetical protein